jgi:very-short-patch-repair endonuclease
MRRNPPLPSRTRHQARTLRGRSTDAEAKLWFHLRAGRLDGFKFRRQYPLPPHVVDFVCLAARLVVEADGSQHGVIDSKRDASLGRLGYRVLRFWDHDILQRTDDVLEQVLTVLRSRTLTPAPLPLGEGRSGAISNEG